MSCDEWQNVTDFFDCIETFWRVDVVKHTAKTFHFRKTRVETSLGLSWLVLVTECEATLRCNILARYEILLILVTRIPLHRS